MLWFDPAGFEPQEGDPVIVSTERGQEYGEIVTAAREVDASELAAELKPVLRIADETDRAKIDELRGRERGELEAFRRLVKRHKLDMKPIGVEHLFDDSKTVFYFVAEERVDFRDLVRDLANEFHTRIDMRQVGVRDEARMVGGLGHCGQPLCCVRFPGEFQPVSIRMAKEQDLPLNPLKISGLCGRLMCCLRYEYDAYKDFKQRAPKYGSPVQTPKGDAKVVGLNAPRESVTIRPLEGGPEMTVPLEALDCSAGRGCPCVLKADAMPELPVTAALAHGSTPQLREADRSGEPASEPRSQRSRRKRPPGGKGEQGSGRTQDAGVKGQRQEPKAAPAAAQSGQTGQPGQQPAGSSGRRRRRRRPRAEGGTSGPTASAGTE